MLFVHFVLVAGNAYHVTVGLDLYILYYFLCKPHLFMIGRAEKEDGAMHRPRNVFSPAAY